MIIRHEICLSWAPIVEDFNFTSLEPHIQTGIETTQHICECYSLAHSVFVKRH